MGTSGRPESCLISVVVPAYNYADLLPRVLDSVLPQLDERFELIVIDDGSTDKTFEILTEYSSRNSRVRSTRQENYGAAAARNNGVRLAKGKYVLLLDADDELEPLALNTLACIVTEQTSVEMVLGAQTSVFPDGKEKLRLPTRVTGAPCTRLSNYLLKKTITISHGSTLFHRKLLLQRPYAENFRGGEDIPVFAYAVTNAETLTTMQPLARIHKHGDSLRHRPGKDSAYAMGLAAEVFAQLPVECQYLRKSYEAQRLLSLFRYATLCHRRSEALYYFRLAFLHSPRQALRGSYLLRALLLVFNFRQIP